MPTALVSETTRKGTPASLEVKPRAIPDSQASENSLMAVRLYPVLFSQSVQVFRQRRAIDQAHPACRVLLFNDAAFDRWPVVIDGTG